MQRVTIPGVALDGARPLPRLECAFQLKGVVDERPAGSEAGGLSGSAYAIADATRIVREQLQSAGFREAADTPQVSVGLQRLYVAQNLTTKVPMAVYRIAVDGGLDFVIRSQASSINWWGTDDEAQRAFVAALDDANRQLVDALNRRCVDTGAD